MEMSRVERSRVKGTRCSKCRKVVPVYDITNLTSSDGGSRKMCGRCCNAEMAERTGLNKFEHLNFEPIEVADCEGRTHVFHFRTHLFGPGVALDAFEWSDGGRTGYRFQMIGEPEGDLMILFARLVEKIRRGLSVQHLKRADQRWQVADRVVRGRIGWDEDAEGRAPLVVIDGRGITWEEFGRMLRTFEGWQFKLQIFDRSEEL